MSDAVATETSTPAQSSESTTSAIGSTPDATTTTQGSDGGSWVDSLPTELKAEKSLQSFKSPADVAKSYVELNRKQGSAVWLPGEKDTPEAKAAKLNDLYAKLGRPESVDKYGIPHPDVRGWSDQAHQEFLQSAFEAGLTKAQAEKMYANVGKQVNGLSPDMKAQRTEAETELRKEWGEGGFDKHMSYAVRAIKHLGGDALMQYFSKSEAGNNPALIRAFAKIGGQLAEDGSLPAASEIFAQQEQTQEQLNAILNDIKGPYYDKTHPDHNKTVEKVYKLNQYLSNAV